MTAAMITRDAWLAALGEAEHVEDASALTTQELAALFGCSRWAAACRAKRLVSEGKAVEVRKRIRVTIGGVRMVPAYRLLTVAAPPKVRTRTRAA